MLQDALWQTDMMLEKKLEQVSQRIRVLEGVDKDGGAKSDADDDDSSQPLIPKRTPPMSAKERAELKEAMIVHRNLAIHSLLLLTISELSEICISGWMVRSGWRFLSGAICQSNTHPHPRSLS